MPITSQPGNMPPFPMTTAPVTSRNMDDELILKEITRHQTLTTYGLSAVHDPCFIHVAALCSADQALGKIDSPGENRNKVNAATDWNEASKCVVAGLTSCVVTVYTAVICCVVFSSSGF